MMSIDAYETIFKRKSIRKYDMNPLPESSLALISEFIAGVVPLRSEINTEIKILTHSEIHSLMAVKAPHYIAISSETSDLYLTNAGYMIQQIDLFLSFSGFGSCYLGMAKPHDASRANMKYEFVILLAFGKAKEPLYRAKYNDFRRKTLEQISRVQGAADILEAARFAPSAVNSQPWFFTGTKDELHAFCIKLNPLTAIFFEKVNKIDMGIALCHLKTASDHFGRQSEFLFNAPPKDLSPAGFYYIATLSRLHDSGKNQPSQN